MTIAEYVKLREVLTNTTFRITPDGKGYFIEDENLLTRDQFNRKYPLLLV